MVLVNIGPDLMFVSLSVHLSLNFNLAYNFHLPQVKGLIISMLMLLPKHFQKSAVLIGLWPRRWPCDPQQWHGVSYFSKRKLQLLISFISLSYLPSEILLCRIIIYWRDCFIFCLQRLEISQVTWSVCCPTHVEAVLSRCVRGWVASWRRRL